MLSAVDFYQNKIKIVFYLRFCRERGRGAYDCSQCKVLTLGALVYGTRTVVMCKAILFCHTVG